jgi:hypothetical protein
VRENPAPHTGEDLLEHVISVAVASVPFLLAGKKKYTALVHIEVV